MTPKRAGRFVISMDYYDYFLEVLEEAFSILRFCPYDCRPRLEMNAIELHGLSPEFSERPPHFVCPYYSIKVYFTSEQEKPPFSELKFVSIEVVEAKIFDYGFECMLRIFVNGKQIMT